MNPKTIGIGRGHQPDYVFAIAVLLLLTIGMVMIYSISPVLSQKLLGSTSRNFYFNGQLLNIAFGVAALIVAANTKFTYWRKFAPLLMMVSLFAVIAVMFPALSYAKNGATRWLRLGPASFQPSELMKLTTIIYLAAWFERRGEEIKTFWDGLVPFLVMLFIAGFVIAVMQKDMGTMLVLVATAIGMFFVAGVRWRHLALVLASLAGLGWAAVITFPHRVSRLTTFLNPTRDPTGAGYHISQALIAIGSGGLFGVGLGRSIQIYGYLPEATNDSIFAVIAEEFGLIGSLIIITLFGYLIFRGFKIAKAAPDSFSRLVASGITLWLLFQTAINIAAMLSLVPLTGIPLPFISYGGSSLVFSLIGAGILLNISKYTVKEAKHANSGERRRNGWSYFTNASNARRIKTAR